MAGIAQNVPASDVGSNHITGSGQVSGSNQQPQQSQSRNAAGPQQQQHCLYGNDPSQAFIKTEYQEHEGKNGKVQKEGL